MPNNEIMQSCVCVKANVYGNISTFPGYFKLCLVSSYRFTCIETMINAKCSGALKMRSVANDPLHLVACCVIDLIAET